MLTRKRSDELEEELFREEVRRLPRPDGVLSSGVGLIIIQALLRGWVGFRGGLTQDDFVFERRAAVTRLGDPHYWFDAYNGHLMPGSFAMVRLARALAPLEDWPPVVMDLVLQAATGVMLLLLLKELFGVRRAILVPLTLFLLCPVTLPGFLWWAAAVNQLPAMLAMVTTAYLHVRYLRSGSTRTGGLAVLAFVCGLAFFEKLLLFAPLVFALTAFWFVPGTATQRLKRALTLHWRVWSLWLLALVPYVAYYVNNVDSTVNSSASTVSYLDFVTTSWNGLHVATVGGPWRWAGLSDPSNIFPITTPVLSFVSSVVTVGVIVGGAICLRESLRAWLFPVYYALATAALLATGRNQVGPFIGMAYRYYAEVALLAALALALSLLPITGTVAKGEITRLQGRAWLQRFAARHGTDGQPWSMSDHSRFVFTRGVVMAVVVSCGISTLAYDTSWHANPAGKYIQTAKHDLAMTDPDTVFAQTPVSVKLMVPIAFAPNNNVGFVFRALPHPPRILSIGGSSDNLSMFDDDGHVRRAFVTGVAAKPGPRSGCGWFASAPSRVVIPMPVTIFDFEWTMRIGYIASTDSRATVKAARQTFHVQLEKGLHALYFGLRGPVSSVVIDGLAEGASLCTDDVRVGPPVALP